jgi:hypothetical protein
MQETADQYRQRMFSHVNGRDPPKQDQPAEPDTKRTFPSGCDSLRGYRIFRYQ